MAMAPFRWEHSACAVLVHSMGILCTYMVWRGIGRNWEKSMGSKGGRGRNREKTGKTEKARME